MKSPERGTTKNNTPLELKFLLEPSSRKKIVMAIGSKSVSGSASMVETKLYILTAIGPMVLEKLTMYFRYFALILQYKYYNYIHVIL